MRNGGRSPKAGLCWHRMQVGSQLGISRSIHCCRVCDDRMCRRGTFRKVSKRNASCRLGARHAASHPAASHRAASQLAVSQRSASQLAASQLAASQRAALHIALLHVPQQRSWSLGDFGAGARHRSTPNVFRPDSTKNSIFLCCRPDQRRVYHFPIGSSHCATVFAQSNSGRGKNSTRCRARHSRRTFIA